MAPGEIRQPRLAHPGRFIESERPKTELSLRPFQLEPIEYVGGPEMNLLARLCNDIIEDILSFLSFRSIIAFISTCKSETVRDRFRLCSVLADQVRIPCIYARLPNACAQRWRHSVEDKGAGRSIPFRLTSSRNWKRTLIAREYTQSCFGETSNIVSTVFMTSNCFVQFGIAIRLRRSMRF